MWLGRSYHGWLETHHDKLGTPVGKEAEGAATKLYRAAVLAGRRQLLIVEPIRRLMRERLKATNLEREREIDQVIEERFDGLERYLEERMG
jgi:hypothetical protein